MWCMRTTALVFTAALRRLSGTVSSRITSRWNMRRWRQSVSSGHPSGGIQKYAGSDAKEPKLNKLGGPSGQRRRRRSRRAVQEIAKDLVQLYAARQERKGFQYGPDTVWQKEFEELFPYDETEDQLDCD